MNALELLDQLFEAAYIVDEERTIVYCNSVFEKITGFSQDEIVGKHCYDNILRHVTESGVQLCHNGCPLQDTVMHDRINTAKVYLHHKKGYRVPVKVRTIPFVDEDTSKRMGIEIFTDYIEEAKIYQENRALKKNAMTDELTQVFNRQFIEYQLITCIQEYSTFGTPLGVLFIDIDHFKQVNDTYGHDVGDNVLKTVARTIALNLRREDYVGRYGGEEFIVILRDVNEIEMHNVAEKLRTLIRNTTTEINDESLIQVTVSIGASFYQQGLSKEAFIKQADSRMYQAKVNGRNQVVSK
ncbi:sensor domain-containing diguanylate cyclase [Candidatus Xianfuyuplasma coldseepsis]|uniref:Sensor domain-containing diguanylate cyclase n=1 Tax=Candidatus Xianfuyuplasma coldseepsis TaxID=2782163 RepID=A0A7L7KNP3_9MOLU|nr:sensor domain-containing diguanylate cyclase [Xianfuyuplasma coldseepsis]QMS84257.1 sensor domain-containing diguanylate cyclase [Xianfuyuplasma coldseepsis]